MSLCKKALHSKLELPLHVTRSTKDEAMIQRLFFLLSCHFAVSCRFFFNILFYVTFARSGLFPEGKPKFQKYDADTTTAKRGQLFFQTKSPEALRKMSPIQEWPHGIHQFQTPAATHQCENHQASDCRLKEHHHRQAHPKRTRNANKRSIQSHCSGCS